MASQKELDAIAEYGEPFFDILAGFAAMGYGMSDAARAVGYEGGGDTLRRLMRRRGWVINWPSRSEQMRRIKAGTIPACAGRDAKLLTHPVTGETLPSPEWAKRIGISRKTMNWRVKHWPLQKALDWPAHRYDHQAGKRRPGAGKNWKKLSHLASVDAPRQV